MVTDTELSELSEEYFKLLNSEYCRFCGSFSVYVDTSHVNYNDETSWPILRDNSNNEPHYCASMQAVGR